jgi:hypothetical protein
MRAFLKFIAVAILISMSSAANAASQRYWRVYLVLDGGGANSSMATLEMRTTPGGAQAATGGTAAASSTLTTYVAANAFDTNPSTFWISNAAGEKWISYDMGSGNDKDITEISITPRNDSYFGETVTWGYVQSSPDNSTWTTVWTFIPAAWASGTAQVFTKPSTLGNGGGYRYWRINATRSEAGGGTGVMGFAEVNMATSSGGTNLLPGTLPSADTTNTTNYAWNAIDGSTSTVYGGTNSSWPHQWVVDLLSGNAQLFTELKINSRDDVYFVEAPLQFCVQRSSDGSTWTTSWCSIAATWTRNQIQTFLRPSYADSLTGGHRCWRIYATAAQNAGNIMSGSGLTINIQTSNSVVSWAAVSADSTAFGDVYNLMDGSTSTIWTSANSAWPHWIAFDFTAGFAPLINHIEWTARNDASYGQAPSAGEIQYSDDCSSWTTNRTFSKSWTQNQTQDLMLVPIGGAPRGRVWK